MLVESDASLNCILDAAHITAIPLIESGNGLTIIVVSTWQPVAVIVYVIVSSPGNTPVTIPVDGVIVAIKVLLLVHTPPGVALLKVMVALTQTSVSNVSIGDNGLTVNVIVLTQPVTPDV